VRLLAIASISNHFVAERPWTLDGSIDAALFKSNIHRHPMAFVDDSSQFFAMSSYSGLSHVFFSLTSHHPPAASTSSCDVCHENCDEFSVRCVAGCSFDMCTKCLQSPQQVEDSQVHEHPLATFGVHFQMTTDDFEGIVKCDFRLSSSLLP
jgi:hypothetical protein